MVQDSQPQAAGTPPGQASHGAATRVCGARLQASAGFAKGSCSLSTDIYGEAVKGWPGTSVTRDVYTSGGLAVVASVSTVRGCEQLRFGEGESRWCANVTESCLCVPFTGEGQYGKVYTCISVDTGELMAMKEVSGPRPACLTPLGEGLVKSVCF